MVPDDDTYPLAEPPKPGQPDPPPTASAGEQPVETTGAAPPQLQSVPEPWHAAIGGTHRGPMSLEEMHRLVAVRNIRAETLVWKQGMPDWVPAGSVPEVFAAGAPPRLPPGSPATLEAGLKTLDRFFSAPGPYRLIGRGCGLAAVAVGLVSVPLWFFGRSWFTGALVLALAFFLGEAAGAILAALGHDD